MSSIASSKTQKFLEKLEQLSGDENEGGGTFDFGIQASINNRISRYGTAVTVGIFMGAAISAGTILGALTWYAVSKNILTDTIKDLGGMLNLSFGSSTNDKTNTQDARSDVTESPKSSVLGQNDNSEMKKVIEQIELLERRVEELEKR